MTDSYFNVFFNLGAKKGELNPCTQGAGAHIAKADNPTDPNSLAMRLSTANVDNPNC